MAYMDHGPSSTTGVPPKKKKKKPAPINITGGASVGGTTATTNTNYYHPPTTSSPPSYSAPSKSRTPKFLQPHTPEPSQPSFSDVINSFKKDETKKVTQRKERKEELNDLQFLLSGDSLDNGKTATPENPDRSSLLEMLQGINKGDRAAPGEVPGADKMGPNEFAWVPDKFKAKRNGKLKQHWDQDFIQSAMSDFGTADSANFFLNGLMEKQYQDREDWLLGKNQRKYNKIKEVLGDAEQAAFKGNYDFLKDFESSHPKFNTETPAYKSKFGVTPESIWKQWEQDRKGLSIDQREDARYRVDMMMDHYDKLRSGTFFSYQQTHKLVDQAIKKYENKYNDSVEFGLEGSDEKKKAAAKLAGPAIPVDPKASKEQQDLYDQAGGDQTADEWRGTYLEALTGKHKYAKQSERQDQEHLNHLRHKAKTTLGVDELPSVKQMLAMKVADGELDPKNEEQVDQWIERFRNPKHPDTRAMYVGYAMNQNPDFDAEEVGLPFINAPVEKLVKQEQGRSERNAKADAETDKTTTTGPLDALGDMWNRGFGHGIQTVDVRPTGGGTGAHGTESNPGSLDTNQLGWTFDKLSRLSYGMAGMTDAWYGLDEGASDWSDGGLLQDIARFPFGQNAASSVDEVVQDPSKLGDVFKAGYQQTFRGGLFPGTTDNLVPTTFSQVIANNAARDPEHNFYDADLYQHLAGLAGDLTLDPLNLIGVGVVNDVLKVPMRTGKVLADAAVQGVKNTPLEFLSKFNTRDLSPIAEKTWRTNQTLRRLDNSDEYVTDAEIMAPVGKIDTQLKALHVQESKFLNDIGVQQLNESLDDISSQLVGSTDSTLTVEKLMAQNSIKVKGTDLENPGGIFWRGYLQPLDESAKMQGFSTTKYADTELGRAASKASIDKNKILDQIDDGTIDTTSRAAREQMSYLDSVIDKGHEVDSATGRPSIFNEPNREEFHKAGRPGFSPGIDIEARFAKAMGKTKDQFLKIWEPGDVHDALTKGPKMIMESDPEEAAKFVQANERISRAKSNLADPNITADYRKANLTALQIGYTQSSSLTMGAAIRYLDVVQDMRRLKPMAETRLTSVRDKLSDIDTKLDELHEQAGEVNTEHLGDYYGGFDGAVGKPGAEGDITSDRIAALEDQREDLVREMTGLEDSVKSTVTGLTPAAAHDVQKMLPSTSQFRKADGTINVDKVKNQFYLDTDKDPHTGLVKHHVGYNQVKDATPEEIQFFNLIKQTLQHDYHKAYRATKTEVTDVRKPTQAKGQVGPNERALGPYPSGKVLREQYPQIFEKYSKGSTKEVRESSVSSPEGWAYTDEDVVIKDGVPVGTEQNLARAAGKRSNKQELLHEFIARKQAKYKKELRRARELDNAKTTRKSKGFKVSAKEQGTITQRAYAEAWDSMEDSLAKGRVKQSTSNMRLTINETARSKAKQVNLEMRYRDTQLKIKELEVTNKYELAQIRGQREALQKEKKEYLANIEKARKEAIETKKAASIQVKTEHVLQIASADPRLEGRMLSVRIAGMRKNLQFTNSLFKGAERAAQLVPAKFRENFANYVYRPTKLLTTKEGILFRAMWESTTPVIIKAHLESLSRSFGEVTQAGREMMFRAYRKGTEYEGPGMNHFKDVANEMGEIESIWNGNHPFYQWKNPAKATSETLTWSEINRFLPKEWAPDLKTLRRTTKENKGKVTSQGLMDSIAANEFPMPADAIDPFRFGWVMRMAADQAYQLKGIHHGIKTTFGVPTGLERVWNPSTKSMVIRLQAGAPREKALVAHELNRLNWQKIPELGVDYVFPPESVKEIQTLLSLTKPGPEATQFSKTIDNALGYWKQSMTIYNPGYYTRNGIGEVMSSWLDGVNHPKWYRMAYRIHKYSKGEDQDLASLVKKWSALEGKVAVDEAKPTEVLFTLKGGQKITVEDGLKWYVNMGLKSTFANTDLDQGVRSLAGSALTDNKVRKTAKAISSKVHDAGEGFEDYLRMAHFLHAMQHSGRGTMEAAAHYAAQKVTKYHFDYSDFSTFEKTVMLRAFPFYKWTRRGAPLMLAHLFMTPGKMSALPKVMDAASGVGFDPLGAITDDPVLSTSDVNEDKNGFLPDYKGIAPGWVRDLFAYQMQPSDDDEYGNYFRVQTPQIDGLNAMLGLTPGSGNNDLGSMFGDSAAYPLLNPMIKAPIELGTNKGMDPDFPYQLYGGEFNEMNGMSPVDSIVDYVARSTSPAAGFLTKMSKNGDLGPASMGEGDYKDEHGYDKSRNIASFAAGLGFYQGMAGDEPVQGNSSSTGNSPAVGPYKLSEIPMFSDRKVAPKGSSKNQKGTPTNRDIADLAASYGGDYAGGGSGWVDYPNSGSGWINYGSGGGYGGGYSSYGSSGSSSGSSSSSSSASLEFWELLQRLKDEIDQGEVT